MPRIYLCLVIGFVLCGAPPPVRAQSAGPPAVDGQIFINVTVTDKYGRWVGGLKAGEQKLLVFAFDAASGKKLWQREISAGPKAMPVIHETNSYASSSPAADA